LEPYYIIFLVESYKMVRLELIN